MAKLKYDVTLNFAGAKINGIKVIRAALGIGLKEAKDASERYGVDAVYTTLTLNAKQFADMMYFAQEEAYKMRQYYDQTVGTRQLEITNITRYEDADTSFDFSNLT